MHRSSLSSHTLDEHPDGHPRRESVRVDDDVGLHSTLGEGHVDGGPLLRANSLLSVTRRELVSDGRRTRDSDLDVDLLTLGVSGVVSYEKRTNERRKRESQRGKEREERTRRARFD